MPHSVAVSKSAHKDLRRIAPAQLPKLIAALGALAETPRPAGVRKLVGSDNRYRVRVGDYRIIYEIFDTSERIEVQAVRHRRDAYRK